MSLFGKVKVTDGALAVIGNLHTQIHNKKGYTSVVNAAALASGASLYIQIDVPADYAPVHLKEIILYTTGSDASYELNEAPTLTTGTVAVAAVNRNRVVPIRPSGLLLFSDPTTISAGTVLDTLLIGSGGQLVGGKDMSDAEFVLNADTRYLLTFTNDDVGVQVIDMKINWYEE